MNNAGSDQAQVPNKQSWLPPTTALTRFRSDSKIHVDVGDHRYTHENSRFGVQFGDYHILIPRHSMSEIVSNSTIYPFPNTPAWMLGLINLRGSLIPVFDLASVLDPDSSTQSCTRIMMLDRGDNAVGLLIDVLPVSIDASSMNATAVPTVPKVMEPYVRSAHLLNSSIWFELDCQALLKDIVSKITI